MKLTYEIVKERFKNRGFILLENEYIGRNNKMKCRCNNGHETYKTVKNLDRDCIRCAAKKNNSYKQPSIKEVSELFEEQGCRLLSEEYINAKSLLDYICVCGNRSRISLDNFKKGARCKLCGQQNLARQFKHDIEYVRERFKERGFILLSESYTNSKQKLDYICSCGSRSRMMYLNFLKGRSCHSCGIKKNSGENHAKYNPNLTDIERKRRLIGYEKWRQSVFERDAYTCLKCERFYGVELNAHHILNFSQRKDLATDVSNGATLCKDCHIEFHKTYGYENNDEHQLKEWLSDENG